MITCHSEIDSRRFGIPIARASVQDLTELSSAWRWCGEERVRMLILRVPASCADVAIAVEEAGGRLMDTLVTWEAQAAPEPPGDLPAGIGIRHAAGVADANLAAQLARGIFAGYASHYGADSRLSQKDVAEVYPSWAAASCAAAAGGGRGFLFVQRDGVDVGFAALARGDEATDIELFGIAADARARGIGSTLLQHAVAHATRGGARRVRYATHLANLAAQRMLCRCGFVPCQARHTFHCWLPR
jgi:ribosomal protein S18 acetylase RimI-like enzyme